MRTLMTTLRLLRDASIIILGAAIYYTAIDDMTKTKDIPKCYINTNILETAKDTNILLNKQTELLHDLSISAAN